jgi:hypothetical protein
MVSFTPEKTAPGTHFIGGWVGPKTSLDQSGRSGHCVEDKNLLPLPGIEPSRQPKARRYTD